jgi:hypothetical protein
MVAVENSEAKEEATSYVAAKISKCSHTQKKEVGDNMLSGGSQRVGPTERHLIKEDGGMG